MKNDLEKLLELRTSLRVHYLENLGKVQVKLTFLHLRDFRNLFLNLYKCNRLFLPRGNTPLYGVAPPERSTYFRLLVYERVGKSVISVCKKAKKG